MNKENVIQLRDFLRALPDEKFDWGDFGTHKPYCGTVACIAGWAPYAFGELEETLSPDEYYRHRMGSTAHVGYLRKMLDIDLGVCLWLISADSNTGRKDYPGEPLYTLGFNDQNAKQIAIRRLSALANGCVA